MTSLQAGPAFTLPDDPDDDLLGVHDVVSFVMCAAAPVTVTGGVISMAFAVSGVTTLPLVFLLIWVVLSVFAVGFTAMQRRITNAGAFYAYIAHGLGKPTGVAAGWAAMLGYTMLLIGLYGIIGTAVQPVLKTWLGITAPWWLVALVACAVVGFFGLRSAKDRSRLLLVLLVAETVCVLAFSVANLANPVAGGIDLRPFQPAELFGSGFGAAFAVAILGFTGFESATTYAEEVRDRRTTVASAIRVCLISTAVLYTLFSFSVTATVGVDEAVATAQREGGDLMFTLAAINTHPVFATVGHLLFASSVFAAMLSYHSAAGNYLFSLGREGILPRAFEQPSAKGGPKWASALLTGLSLATIVLFLITGWDPQVHMFYWLGTTGGFGVLSLLALTSWAVLGYRLDRKGESKAVGLLAPGVALALLALILFAVVTDFHTLLGVEAGHPARWMLPCTFLVAALVGYARAAFVYVNRPDVYAGIGLGAHSATGRATLDPDGTADPDRHDAAADTGHDREGSR